MGAGQTTETLQAGHLRAPAAHRRVEASNGFASAGSACGSASNTVCDNADTCTPSGTCLVNNVANGSPCGDHGVDCRVDDTCQSGSCQDNGFELAGTACGSPSNTVCDDPDTCNNAGSCLFNLEPPTTECRPAAGECDVGESCDGAGACVHTNNSDPCEDGDLCTGPDACSGGACVTGGAVDCDDGSICTIDTCDSGLGCQNVGEPLPESFCVTAGKVSLQVKNTGDPSKAQMKWKWVKGG